MTIEKTNASIGSIVDYINEAGNIVYPFGIDNMPLMSAPYHSFIAQGKDGKLYEWGSYSFDNLHTGGESQDISGFGMIPLRYSSGNVADYTRVGNDTHVLMDNGSLYTYGRNLYGACGVGSTSRVGTVSIVYDLDDLDPDDIFYTELIPTSNMSGEINSHMTYVKKNDGTYWGWGNASNSYGRFGDGLANRVTSPQQISATPDNSDVVKLWNIGGQWGSTYVLTQAGNLYGCGYNGYGCLGIGNSTSTNTWKKITGFTNSLIKDIQGGRGYNSNSQSSTVFLLTNGHVYTCGDNTWGQLGTSESNTGDVHTPTRIALLGDVGEIHCTGGGPMSVYAVYDNRERYCCWGYNNYGQLGVGSTTNIFEYINISINIKQLTVSNGNDTSEHITAMAILDTDDQIWVTGYNAYGVVGDGTTSNKNSLVKMEFYEKGIKQIKLSQHGGNGSLVLHIIMDDGRMYATGYGGFYGVHGILDHGLKENVNSYPRRMC